MYVSKPGTSEDGGGLRPASSVHLCHACLAVHGDPEVADEHGLSGVAQAYQELTPRLATGCLQATQMRAGRLSANDVRNWSCRGYALKRSAAFSANLQVRFGDQLFENC